MNMVSNNFDEECLDLAEHFLQDKPALAHKVDELAEHIQIAVEDWFENPPLFGHQAKASMIAAAPDMLAILKALIHSDNEALVWFVPSDAHAQRLRDDVNAAIAKAEGRKLAMTSAYQDK